MSICIRAPSTTIWYYAPESSALAKQVWECELKRAKQMYLTSKSVTQYKTVIRPFSKMEHIMSHFLNTDQRNLLQKRTYLIISLLKHQCNGCRIKELQQSQYLSIAKNKQKYVLVHHLALARCIFGPGQVICPHVQVFLRMCMLPRMHISANVKSQRKRTQ